MAFQEYKSTESVNSMTTRQLRKYISDKGAEAQKRLDSMNISEQSQAIQDSIHFITKGTNSRVYKGTSNLTKAEMREMADQLRIFNRLDTESKYARNKEYETNKQRYEKFINNRMDDPYWKKYVQDGKVTREGYSEYKKYINFVKEISEVAQYFSYKTLLTKATKQLATGQEVNKRLSEMSKIINDVFKESDGQGLTPRQLTEQFYQRLFDYEEEQNLKHTVKRSDIKGKPEKYKPKFKKTSKPKSSSNVKAKQGRKMKTHGTVHR